MDPITSINAPRGTPSGLQRPTLSPDSVNPPLPALRTRKVAQAPAPVGPPPCKSDIVLALLEKAQQNAVPLFQGRIERLPGRLRSKLSPALARRLAEYRAAWTAHQSLLNEHDSSKAHGIREQQHAAAVADPLGAPTPQPLETIKRTLRLRREAIIGAFRKTAVPSGLALTRDFISALRPLLQQELDLVLQNSAEWEREWNVGFPIFDTRAMCLAKVVVSLDSQIEQAESHAATNDYCLAECLHLLY